MRTVRADDGSRYLLRKRASDAWLVADPVTGEERYIDPDRLELQAETAPLETIGTTVSADTGADIGVQDDRALGLLVVLARTEPIAAIDLIECTELCESDLNGLLTELRVGGLVASTSDPVLGYELTPRARSKLPTAGSME
ncbi:DUF7346 family protein [Halocatena pleomorpha]|uniref:MarR family transcriptional regulator n=1 Tax=Halocatena pleomorpha TaxID=1785090 RepID=A0A3P3RDV0_9EURY|nr:hypothetical protein [Halocatena pleomorpha]RRJ31682.1 hypothetical protein EIK79_06380 [Halocatena pleomorpha]